MLGWMISRFKLTHKAAGVTVESQSDAEITTVKKMNELIDN